MQLLPEKVERVVVYGADESFTMHDAHIVPYHTLDALDWDEDPRPRERAVKTRKRTAKR